MLDLECERGHGFEGWFASKAAFDDQLACGQVCCPNCGTLRVVRRPSAPYVQTRQAAPSSSTPGTAAVETLTQEILAHLRLRARSLEDVGENFAEEARRIHYGDSEPRGIKGRTSGEDLRDLLEEGIAVLPVPSDEDLH